MAACANKTRREGIITQGIGEKGLNRQMLKDGGKGNILKKFVLLRVLTIIGKRKDRMTEQQRMKEFAHLCQ